MGISIKESGSFRNTESYLAKMRRLQIAAILVQYGDRGVAALRAATPVESGESARGWYYKIVQRPGYCSLRFYNENMENGTPVVVLIQYGHGTKNGGYVEGTDFINPAIQPIFEQIATDVAKEVT